jgi:hypothetical protein
MTANKKHNSFIPSQPYQPVIPVVREAEEEAKEGLVMNLKSSHDTPLEFT